VPVPITARVFDILAALVAHAGRPVDKDTLIRLVWGEVIVEEGNLARNVSTLRRVLGELPDDHRYVVTLPGRGYQFVAAVRSIPPDDSTEDRVQEAPAPPGSSRQRVRLIALCSAVVLSLAGGWLMYHRRSAAAGHVTTRLAVLPFKNLGAASDDYFSQGMTDEITTRLAAVRGLQVISRTSADRYGRTDRSVSQIGAELGVDYLLEGSIRSDHVGGRADRLRVTAQLIRVDDDTHLWSETYDRELVDVFEVQSDLARRVVIELRGALAPEDATRLAQAPTGNLEAYRAYLTGVFFASIPNASEAHLTRIVAEFQRAVDLDPQFALAFAGLARAHEGLYRFAYDVSEERAQLARRALERAEALAPDSVAVLLARSRYASTIGNDVEGALRAAESAERLRPNDAGVIAAAGNSRMMAARWPEAASTFERAVQLDPRSPGTTAVLGLVYTALRRHADAELALTRSLAVEPDQMLANVVRVWNTWLWRGDLAAARAHLDKLRRHDDWRFMEIRFLQALYERRYDRAREELEAFEGQWMRDWVLTRPVVLFEAQAWRLAGNGTRALEAFEQSRRLLAAEAARVPADGRVRSSLAIALAGLGRKEEVHREAKAALTRMRLPQGFDTAAVREDVALALTMIGDIDLALAEIETLLNQPAFFSAHTLRLDPRWDPLRTDPRYQALTAPR
jgi:TolB-like protein/DNA-binding winged helix-turn-helix (wHTH) protein/Flp pilus assembly protein TadD